MPETIVKKYFESMGHQYGINKLRKRKALGLALTEGLEGKNILDIGCASGYLARELKRDHNFVAGVDISEKHITEAKKVLDEAYALDIENDPWPVSLVEKKFDIIICGEVIEHLFDQDAFLEKVKILLRPSGKLIMTTPNFLLWNSRIRMLFGQFGFKEVLYDKSHIHLMSYRGFHEKIIQHGYRIMAEDNVWYPNWLERWKKFLPPNLFVFQTITKLEVVR